MLSYRSPGIYFEETATGPRPIQAVGTSTAALLGVAPNPRAHVGEALRVDNWQHFIRMYCEDTKVSNDLARAVFGFFQNEGASLFVCNIGQARGLSAGLEAVAEIDEVALVAAPGMANPADWDAILAHCESLGDRFAILDAPSDVESLESLTEVATAEAGATDDEERRPAPRGNRPRNSDRGFGAYYFPWIGIRDPITQEMATTPPSGHLAGVYARSDATRGVHKAPANEAIRGALSVSRTVSRAAQASLNDAGVNCIRFFPSEGIRVWGARTLAQGASEWRYVNVRRLFNMVEESIAEGTRWVVFEPNDASLWKSIRRDVSAFLLRVARTGALRGDTPEDGFFVQCDAETNPEEVIDAGQVVTVIGLAPTKPAEFVIFRIGQSASGTELVAEGGEA